MKTRTITIAKTDIFADVDAETHVLARMTEGKDLQRADALESDSDDDLAKSMLTRYADRRVAELKERTARFLDTEAVSTAAGGSLSTDENYSFAFYLEDDFRDELLQPLAHSIEEYIAEGVIADWYKANAEPQAAAHEQLLPGIQGDIISAIINRRFPTRL